MSVIAGSLVIACPVFKETVKSGVLLFVCSPISIWPYHLFLFPVVHEWCLIVVFILISPKSNKIEHLYIRSKFSWSVFPFWIVLFGVSLELLPNHIEPEIFSHYFKQEL